jgi:hypothetical protein
VSRASVVALLVAAELWVVGMAIWAMGGRGPTFASGMHHADFTPAAVSPIAAGAAPHVVVDDVRSRVNVAASSDQLVHVRDLTRLGGMIFSSRPYPQLRVERTPDGVRIERPSVENLGIDLFGYSTQSIEVLVPSGSQVDVQRCAGANVTGIDGGVSVHSQDGHVKLADLQGNVDARSDDGYIEASNVRGDRLAMASMDGHLGLQDVSVGSLSATTHDGRIEASGLSFTGDQPDATLHSADGSIKVQLAPNADLTIDASTDDGRIYVDGSSERNDGSTQRTIRLGSGTGKMTVGTSDGSIRIFTNGVPQ